MDNPQHYQPLSHALHNPQSYIHSAVYPKHTITTHNNDNDDNDEEEDDDEQQRTSKSAHNSPRLPPVNDNNSGPDHPEGEQPTKRRPGRPRGSKNKKPRAPPGTSSKYLQQHQQHQPGQQETTIQQQPQQQPPEVNAQNHQYYEFQWRMLTLCSEFYGAAEELLKGTPPLVLAQCYQMGPTAKVDPLNLLNEAKRICGELLRNPQRLITQPPPPMMPTMPNYYPHPYTTSVLNASPTVTSPPSTGIISNPGTFTIPLNPTSASTSTIQQQPQPGPSNTTYAPYSYTTVAGAGAAYYQYSYPQTSSLPTPSPATGHNTHNTNNMTHPGSGAWSDEESEKLRKLAEASRNSSGDIDWDAVVAQWGPGRTRHQILIKATAMGLKASSGPSGEMRGIKRRHGPDDVEGASPAPSSPPKPPPPPPPAPPTSSSSALNKGVQGTQQQPRITPHTSPALHHPQPPQTPQKMPWPMPTVAVNAPSPVLEERRVVAGGGAGNAGGGGYGGYGGHRPNTGMPGVNVHHPTQRPHPSFVYPLGAQRKDDK